MFMSQKRLSFQSMFTKIFLLNMMCTIYYINAEWFFYNTLYIYIYQVLLQKPISLSS